MSTEVKYVDGINYQQASIFTIAEYGPLEAFLEKYNKEVLNDQNKYGFSLLHEALSGKKWDIAEFLINEGIDVNLTDKSGNTALHYLCDAQICSEVLQLVQTLLDKGASVNAQNKDGDTPLINASAKTKGDGFERFKLLLNYKPDITIQNTCDISCLSIAERKRDQENPDMLNYLKTKGLI